MKTMDELGDWRRTHYSKEVTPKIEGSSITIFGWVTSIRRQGRLNFLVLQDKEGVVQVTAHEDKAPKDVSASLKTLREHSTVGVQGVVRSIEKAPHGAEVIPKEIRVLGLAERPPPFMLYGGKLPTLDKRLDIRAVDLRRPRTQAVFKIRHNLLAAMRRFFVEQGYIEVNTPKIIATATEGGASLFPLLYYDKEAFLAQSPQLYKEQLVLAFEKVFEIGPIFRAEKSRTLKHLSEVTSVDVEEAYVSYVDILDVLEKITCHVVQHILESCQDELKLLKRELQMPKRPFKRYTYDDVLKALEASRMKTTWGEDLSTQALQKFGEVESEFYFITDWPTASKPFYIKPKADKPEVCESFDFMYSSIELASGGTRISSRKMLTQRLKDQGLKPKLFEYHLKIFDYGMPPHAGFGLGLERLMMALTGEENIREVTLYPRDQFRLAP